MSVEEARAVLEAAGYVVLRAKSHRLAQRRLDVAEALRVAAEEYTDKIQKWAERNGAEERKLRDRLTFVYGVARARGATLTELAGPETPAEVLEIYAKHDAEEATRQ